MPHSIEEIRSAALDALAGRVECSYSLNQFAHLKIAVGTALRVREGAPPPPPTTYPADTALSREDADAFLEVFWDLFRDGVITLGPDSMNPQFPHFRLTERGKAVLSGENTYFLHDLTAFERQVRERVPEINDVTLLYLKESLQAFRSGCTLASSVMLGVAAEHTFLQVLDAIEGNSLLAQQYSSIAKERTLIRKINKFKNLLLKHSESLPKAVRDDLDTNLLALQSLIRTFRNESGHPSGQLLDREQAFVNIQVFVPFCRKANQLIEHFRTA